MAYVLEKLSESDMDLIISHVDGDKYRHTKYRFTDAKKYGAFTKNWAIDREKNSYFLSIPKVEREDIRAYCIILNGNFYQIDQDEIVDQGFRFSDRLNIDSAQLESLKEEIRQAFASYGKFGSGPLDEEGNAYFVVNPKFL